jgi:hypothetical protein
MAGVCLRDTPKAFPSPLWGGAQGWGTHRQTRSIDIAHAPPPPTPAPLHKGEGSAPDFDAGLQSELFRGSL